MQGMQVFTGGELCLRVPGETYLGLQLGLLRLQVGECPPALLQLAPQRSHFPLRQQLLLHEETRLRPKRRQ